MPTNDTPQNATNSMFVDVGAVAGPVPTPNHHGPPTCCAVPPLLGPPALAPAAGCRSGIADLPDGRQATVAGWVDDGWLRARPGRGPRCHQRAVAHARGGLEPEAVPVEPPHRRRGPAGLESRRGGVGADHRDLLDPAPRQAVLLRPPPPGPLRVARTGRRPSRATRRRPHTRHAS
jgi:hypothetical protein